MVLRPGPFGLGGSVPGGGSGGVATIPYSNADPSDTAATADSGVSTDVSRADHVHQSSLADLADVNVAGAADGDALVYDSGASKWIPAAGGVATALDDLADVDAPTPADGDVLTFDSGSGDWIAAAPSGGGGSGALVLLEQHTGSASASLVFTTAITSTYDEYLIELVNVLPATDGAKLRLRMSTNGGSSYDSGTNYYYGLFAWVHSATGTAGGDSQSEILLGWGSGISNAASEAGLSGHLRLFNPLGTSAYKGVQGQLSHYETSPPPVGVQVHGYYKSTTAVDALQFAMDSGNITSGTIRIYGVAK